MAKKKKGKKNITLAELKQEMEEKVKAKEQLYNDTPEFKGVIHKDNWDFIAKVNVMTQHNYDETWTDNLRANVKNGLLKKHPFLVEDCLGLGKNKAVIGVGSGASFNKNRNDLAWFLSRDGTKEWPYRNYITICANHQFKPLLNMGIIPDFVLLVDASDVVYDQLCTDIPDHGKSTILITGLHCSPKTLSKWNEQGRHIRFVLNSSNKTQETFEKLTGKNPKTYTIELGGNVLNGAWVIGITKFLSNVFMCVGNDLSFKLFDDVEEQRKNYYSDNDYSTNAKVTGTGRDEAGRFKRWAGFELTRRPTILLPGKSYNLKKRYDVKLDLVGTSHTLWVYKTWLESTLLAQLKHPVSFHYFNCSEAGILGVMSKTDNPLNKEEMRKTENWFFLDEVCRFYHTAILKDAMEHFEKCREVFDRCNLSNTYDALAVIGSGLQGSEDIVGNVDPLNAIRKNRIEATH